MFGRIKELLGEISQKPQGALVNHSDKKVAAAALMVEAAGMDDDFGSEEREKIIELMQNRLGLTAEDGEELLSLAEEKAGSSSQLFAFTRVINDSHSPEERIEFIEMMWEVVYADGELHHYEANLMRRIAGLLYVSDRDSGDARKKALARLGLKG